MKYIVQDWGPCDDGYLFCIQKLQEMLFHYSGDTVKVPVHNTRTLLEEYVDIEKSVAKGDVKQYQLDVIAKEVKEGLSSDLILHEMYKNEEIEEIKNFLEKDQKSAIHYIFNRVQKNRYYDMCCKYLKENISKANRKAEIDRALRSWLTYVIWYGYSPEYIYRFLWNMFEGRIDSPKEAVYKFLDRFDFKKNSYKVYFVFYGRMRPYQRLLEERLNVCFEADGFFEQIKRNSNAFIGSMNVDAYDDYAAMRQAYKSLEIFLRFFEVFTNDSVNVIGKNGLVVRDETGERNFLPVKSFGYKNIKPEPQERFDKEIDTIVLLCQDKEIETYFKLRKIVDLHNAALRQQDLNDAFLNLWSALEVASSKCENKSKIENVIESIVPILQNDYYECVFGNISDDLRNNLGERKFRLLLDRIEEYKDDVIKVAGFVLLEKYEKLREEYFAGDLERYPNIRYKIYNLYKCRIRKADLWKPTEKYAQKIQWHLYRLYRLRNAIVHAGESHKRIQILGEHLHIYVDRVILELMIKLAADKCLGTIQDVLVDTRLLLEKKKKYFNLSGEVDEVAIEKLFGQCFLEE